jgi:hypothetical protein
MSTEWFYIKRLVGEGYIIWANANIPICAVNDEEHARIICAAPEMLKALEQAVNVIERLTESENGMIDTSTYDAIVNAKAAIAKAKGGQP